MIVTVRKATSSIPFKPNYHLSSIIYQLSCSNSHLSFRNMARNVTYSVSPRINPRDRETEPKYYGHVQANGDINLREMSERIQQTCTVHKSDVFAVLVALEDVITDALKNGEIVRLGDLGTLQIGISSKGALKEEDWEESLIKKARINFRPGTVLSNILGNLTFTKVKPRSSKADKEASVDGDGDA